MPSAVLAMDSKKTGSSILAAAKSAAKSAGGKVVVEVDAEDLVRDAEPKYPKEARIKKAENGYIICWYEGGKEYMMGGEKQYIAKDLDEAVSELKKYME